MKYKLPLAFLFLFNFVVAQVPSDWDESSTYSAGALVISNGTTYIAQQDVNTAGTALTDTSYWLSLDAAAPSSAPTTSAPTTPPDASEVSSLTAPDNTTLTESKLINISTRGYVGTGDEVLIGGFVISGDQNKTVLVRTLGPSLASQGVSGSLSDPWVYVVNQANPTVLIDSNDNWASAPGIDAISGTIYEPGDSNDSAMILTLEPGAYTAVVSGINNSTGVALIEVNEFE